MGRHTLRITIAQTNEAAMLLTLEGRVVGPWAAELSRVWAERFPRLSQSKLSIDLSDVTYVDADGTRVLKEIYSQTQPDLVATTPWTQHLAREIAGEKDQLS
jgi:anti-anti-sigma regulatory factor